ncbi:type IX secretion system protein PorQ [Flavihumibacter profundi]|uniref:type IX secretion system protein PorQ n=1 Tax=Flavihumibacter profundi TaxID=2716883 RepID=UPI001CC4FB20|nr:type IX secretion system protein PorQ [Flavihumibacter profundi]MBZ5856682.1 type IX secretion system protein PorQ [Flavihumibacter profundi]
MRHWLALILFITFSSANAQVAGGADVYNFLRLPVSALHTALGGENISVLSNDVTMGYQQPALLRPEMHQQLGFVFTSLPAGIKNIHFTGSMYSGSLSTSFAASVQYFSYGNIVQTDAAGNEDGEFKPKDFVAQVSASRRYAQHWFYGSAIKFIQSDYGMYKSNAMAMDIGVNYADSVGQWQVGLLMKNMGVQLTSYSGEGKENLPFDLQLGITKRLLKAPIQFSLTARELHRMILYSADSSGSFDKIMQHFVVATQFFIADKIELTAGYNHLKRRELSIANTANGLTGFSLGVGVLLPRLQLRYARAYQSNSKAYNQFGMNIDLAGN